MLSWIFFAAVIAGAASAPRQHVGQAEAKNIAILQNFPYVVQLEFYLFWSTIDWSQQCAGVILNNRNILTAASCLHGWAYEARFRRVRAGASFRNAGGLIFYVQDRLNHPRWDALDHDGDVGVLRTMTNIAYGPVIQQAALAAPGSWIPHGLRLSQPGWGRSEQPSLTNQEVLTADRGNCGRIDGSFSIQLNATEHILCTIPPTGIASNNDVGSPWVFNGITVGMVGGINSVGVYNGLIGSDVSHYTEWIVHTVEQQW